MSASLDAQLERIRSAEAMTKVVLPLLRAQQVTEPTLEALRQGVDRVEDLCLEISQNVEKARSAFKAAANIVEGAYLKRSFMSFTRLGNDARNAVAELEGLRAAASGEAAALLNRVIKAEDGIHQNALRLASDCAEFMEELDHEAKTDPVLASLLDAPEDDEPFTDRQGSEIRESLLSGHEVDEPGRRHA